MGEDSAKRHKKDADPEADEDSFKGVDSSDPSPVAAAVSQQNDEGEDSDVRPMEPPTLSPEETEMLIANSEKIMKSQGREMSNETRECFRLTMSSVADTLLLRHALDAAATAINFPPHVPGSIVVCST